MKIVAPAGNMDRFYAAIKAGAKEIYMGIKGFGARRNAQNFTLEEYKSAIDYAHKRGVKIFLTLNTVMMENEMDFLYENVKALYEYGLDAIIVQDLGYFHYLKANFPNIEYHGSTQMTVANHFEAEYLRKIGFTRVVLPREMTYEEIKSIRENTKIELEIFVSGALCVCYSGNCYLSSFVGSRSGNRGMCAQPCRKKYELANGEQGYFISPKDQLLGFTEIQKLKEIGIESIKLEGRMKDPKYVYETVSYYDNAIKGVRVEQKTADIFNRGYSKGFFYGNDDKIINSNYSSSIGKLLGRINGRELRILEDIMLGDGITFLSENYEKLGGSYINKIELKNGKKGDKKAQKGEIIVLRDFPRGSRYVYKSFDKAVNDDVESRLKKENNRLEIDCYFCGKIGEKPYIIFKAKNNFGLEVEAKYQENQILEKANKANMTPEKLQEKLAELGDTTFCLEKFECDIDKEVFLPLSLIKGMKRECATILEEKIIESYRKKVEKRYLLEKEDETPRELEIVGIVRNDNQRKVMERYGVKKIYNRGRDVAKEGELATHSLDSKLASNLYQLLENKNDDVLVNWNLNITNRYTIMELEKIGKVRSVIISPELSFEKIKNIGKVKVKKAILGYSKLKGMHIELSIFDKDEILSNSEGDNFIAKKNEYGNTEIYLEKPLNILNDFDKLKELNIDEVVIELNDESEEEIKAIFENMKNKTGFYKAYNYERGIY